MNRHTQFQLTGLTAFVLVSAVAFALASTFTGGYTLGLALGFGIGLAVALFQYGVVIETETEMRSYPNSVAKKIDKVFES